MLQTIHPIKAFCTPLDVLNELTLNEVLYSKILSLTPFQFYLFVLQFIQYSELGLCVLQNIQENSLGNFPASAAE